MPTNNPYFIKLNEYDSANVAVIQTLVGTKPADATNLHGDFNLGLHVFDEPTRVHHNRASLLSKLQDSYPNLKRIHWLNQVHGEHVYHVTDALPFTTVNADAHITTNQDIALAIMTADCVPVMISGTLPDRQPLIAGIHAGWQGIAKGVIAKTVQKMLHQVTMSNQDVPLKESVELINGWQAWVGACIDQDSYEVDDRVKQGVLAGLHVEDAMAEQLFRANPNKSGHYFANLALAAERQLNQCGIYQVSQSGLNSHADARFYSYRRQTQQGLATTGRMVTLIFYQP